MTTSGWAIKVSYADVGETVVTSLLGRHYFARGRCSGCTGPNGLSGYRTAVFQTRRQARDAARVAGKGYDRATAVRVDVTVAESLIPGYLVVA